MRIILSSKVTMTSSMMIKKQEKKMSEALVRKTHFTLSEIERLLGVYREHSEQIDAMHRNNFRLFELLLLIQTLIMVTILLLS